MDDKSPMELLYIATEYVFIGAFLIMVIYVFSLRDSYSKTRNEELSSQANIKQYREFNSYDMGECTGVNCENHIYGDEAIALIRRYYDDSSFEIYIDKVSENGDSLIVNATESSRVPIKYTLEELQKTIDSRTEFHPYLVYNGVNPSYITFYQEGVIGSVTGISLYWKTDNKVVSDP